MRGANFQRHVLCGIALGCLGASVALLLRPMIEGDELSAAEEAILFGGVHPTTQDIVASTVCQITTGNSCPYFSGPCTGGGITCGYTCPATEMPWGTGIAYQYDSSTQDCPEGEKPRCKPGQYFGCWCDEDDPVTTSTCSNVPYTYYRFGTQSCSS
jgi:hypothetical protein